MTPVALPVSQFQRPQSRGFEVKNGVLCEAITFVVTEGEGVTKAEAGNYRGHLLGRCQARVLGNSYEEDCQIAMLVFVGGHAKKL